jgi:cytoskeletal protein CcmA (bactofilin family)
MALLNNEAKKNLGPELSVKPLSARIGAVLAPAVEELLPPPSQAALTPGRSTYLDASSEMSGKLSFAEPARIDGRVDGEIDAQDGLTIGKGAVVTATIKGVSILVAGTVSGDISASQRIELHASAKVSGNLTAPKLIVHEGAVFDGDCAMQPQGACEDRKLGVLRKEARTVGQGDDQEPADR